MTSQVALRVRRVAMVGALAAMGGFAGAASAAVINVNSVVGEWIAATPAAAVTGLNTNQISWGVPVGSSQSSYVFNGEAPPPVLGISENVEFTLGTFTHNNFPIFAPSLTTARLRVDFDLTVDMQNVFASSFFDFTHLETNNTAGTCLSGSLSVCDDRVSFVTNPDLTTSFKIGDTKYVVNISGFLIGGSTATSWLTQEGLSNTAFLTGIVTEEKNIPPVPVPAALPLLLSGLAGLGFVGRRRRKLPG